MDFHGSYGHAVKNLKDARRLHPTSFAASVDENQAWIRDRIEGPNLSNVFKRTFYQMAFKFQLGKAEGCAGCVLAIPRAVWERWRHLLGDPTFESAEHQKLASPRAPLPSPAIAWILAFDLEAPRGWSSISTSCSLRRRRPSGGEKRSTPSATSARSPSRSAWRFGTADPGRWSP